MEFVKVNFVNSAGAILIDSNTTAAENLINWDLRKQYISDGYNDDLTSTSITYSFSETLAVDRIAILEHNLKDFSIYYNGTTASVFALTTTAATTTCSFNANSETSHYFYTTQVNCTSVTLQMNKTIVADVEKAIGYFLVSAQELDFERIPAAGGYAPKLVPKQIIHKMSDGGVRRHRSHDKWHVDLKFKYISTTFRNSLKSIYDSSQTFVYVPFGTSTGWDGIIFESVWENNFDFYTYADNAATAGFKGSIKLSERS